MWQVIVAFVLGVLLTGGVGRQLTVRWARNQSEKRRRLLRRTRRAERLAELGTLTGHLAHEIRNPLSTIKLNLQLLAEDIGHLAKDSGVGADVRAEQSYPQQLKRIKTLTGETDRLAETLSDFLRYAGQLELHPKRCDVNELLDDLIDFYEPQALSREVQIRRSLSGKPLFCQADAEFLKPAILNLLINATQAMQDGGELILRSGSKGDEAIIEVIDTGPGIAPEQQEKVFEAYFTSRPGGTGLGLPTCRRIIEEHNGHIGLHSEPGKGTKFTISLPLVE